MSCNFQIKFRILVQLIVLSELAIEGVGSRTNLESRRDNNDSLVTVVNYSNILQPVSDEKQFEGYSNYMLSKTSSF